MAKNDFKAFATDRNANVMSQEEWEALPALLSGFTAGKASSAQVNKVIRQASFIAAALAQFVSDKTQRDVLDNGDLPGFVELLGSGFAVEYLSRKNPFGDIKSDGTVKTALENLGLGELSAAGVSGGAASASGYITIPMIINGARRVLYIQWGGFTGTTDSSGSNGIYETSNITVTWPVAFPNAVFQVITGGSSDVSGVGQQEMAWSLGKTKTNGIFGFQCRTPNASMTGSYLVIGY